MYIVKCVQRVNVREKNRERGINHENIMSRKFGAIRYPNELAKDNLQVYTHNIYKI